MLVQYANMIVAVKLSADAFMVCLSHALSTEEEEVMGLLIGEVILPVTKFERFSEISLLGG